MPPPSTKDIHVFDAKAYAIAEIARIKRQHAERNAPPPVSSLDAALSAWWASLPAVTRIRRYQLVEISDALQLRTGKRFADRFISRALEARGWTSGRSWTRAGRNRRYHIPPVTQL